MKKILISLLSIIFIISMFSSVYAATGSISVGSSSDTVVKGKTFTVTVAGTADENITGMQAKLTYDSNKLSIESKAAGQGFSDVSGSNEIAIAATNNENLSKAGTLYTITFKVLNTATEGETTVSVTNAVLALVNEQSVQENTTESNGDITINIKADDTTAGNKEEQKGNNTTTPTNTTDSGNKSTGSSSSNNTTKKTTKLPQTGIESVSIIAIIALGAIGIASYVSYRKYKNI